jgi:hypothetical protein
MSCWQYGSALNVGLDGIVEVSEEDAQTVSDFARLSAGGKWIRTFSSGASGEADAILPVKDRPR